MKIEIDLSTAELDALEKGVELWESDPSRANLMGGIFGAMLGPKKTDPGYADYKRQEETEARKAERAVQARKVLSLRLRAKLLEVRERVSEFAVDHSINDR